MDNSEKLIKRIREDNLKPMPRWRFNLKNVLAWLVFTLAVGFGALAFSVILFTIQQVEFDLLAHMSHSFFEMLLALLPILWIIMLVVFLIVAIISIRNSRKGYKFTSLSLIGICTALSVLSGTLFFITGGGKWLENSFDTHIGLYESVQDRKVKLWSMPEDGYLSGTITNVRGDNLDLEDFTGKEWVVNIMDIDIVPSVTLKKGEMIKIIGKMASRDTFIAEKIRPWGSGERMKGKGQKK